MVTSRRDRLLQGAALALVVTLALASTADAGKPPPSEPAQYMISMSDLRVGAMGVTSDCDGNSSFLAREERTAGFFHADGSENDLNLRLHTDVPWSRKYPVAGATEGVFDGCFGMTPSLKGNLFIDFEQEKGQSVIHIIWHFDYYIASRVREHFTMQSEHIPFPAWTGADVSERVTGKFDLQYSLHERNRPLESYTSLTGGAGRQFDFLLTITRVS